MPDQPLAEVLVVEPDADLARQVVSYLSEHGCDVEHVDDGEKAYNRLDDHPFDVLVAQLNAPRVDGMRVMAVARERYPDIGVVFITSEQEVELATEAMRQGAYDFQVTPLNLAKLEAVVQRVVGRQNLVVRQFELQRQLDERYGLGNVIGKSRQMVQVYNALRQISASMTPVLLQGEPGVGKDLIAHALHTNGPRRNESFVKLNCARISEAMIEAELFGYVKGAFPGAIRSRAGRLELADKGVLFLDDVDKLSPPLQDRLTEVFTIRRFSRMGDTRTISVDIRFITATSLDLATLVEEGSFSRDLQRLLADAVIEVPSLRARREDIPLLVEHFIQTAAHDHERQVDGISHNAMDLLLRYEWPGNVRELRNIIEGMVITARRGHVLEVNDVPEYVRRSTAPEVGEIRLPTGTPLAEVERIVIEETMKVCAYNKEECARTLGIGLRTLYRKLKEYEET